MFRDWCIVLVLCSMWFVACDGTGDDNRPDPAVGVLTSTAEEAALRAAGQATRDAGGGTSVILFVTDDPARAGRIADADGVAFAEWLDNGQRFVGYAWSENAYRVMGADGSIEATFGQESRGNHRDSVATSTNDGATVLLAHEYSGDKVLREIASGEERPFAPGELAGINVQFEFSPDGKTVAFNHVEGDVTTAYIADADGSNSRPLPGAVSESFGVLPGGWSPDGAALLIERRRSGCAIDCVSYVVKDLAGQTVWSSNDFSHVQWAGRGRLFGVKVGQVGATAVTYPASFIDVATGRETQVDSGLAERELTFSPDGEHAITRLGEGAGWEQRCALVKLDRATGELAEVASVAATPADHETVFCATVDWSADGNRAIVSAGGI
jgi:hypothetical protein